MSVMFLVLAALTGACVVGFVLMVWLGGRAKDRSLVMDRPYRAAKAEGQKITPELEGIHKRSELLYKKGGRYDLAGWGFVTGIFLFALLASRCG